MHTILHTSTHKQVRAVGILKKKAQSARERLKQRKADYLQRKKEREKHLRQEEERLRLERERLRQEKERLRKEREEEEARQRKQEEDEEARELIKNLRQQSMQRIRKKVSEMKQEGYDQKYIEQAQEELHKKTLEEHKRAEAALRERNRIQRLKEARSTQLRKWWRDAFHFVRDEIRHERRDAFLKKFKAGMEKERRKSLNRAVIRANVILRMRELKDEWVVCVDDDDWESANDLDIQIKALIEKANKLRLGGIEIIDDTKVIEEKVVDLDSTPPGLSF